MMGDDSGCEEVFACSRRKAAVDSGTFLREYTGGLCL